MTQILSKQQLQDLNKCITYKYLDLLSSSYGWCMEKTKKFNDIIYNKELSLLDDPKFKILEIKIQFTYSIYYLSTINYIKGLIETKYNCDNIIIDDYHNHVDSVSKSRKLSFLQFVLYRSNYEVKKLIIENLESLNILDINKKYEYGRTALFFYISQCRYHNLHIDNYEDLKMKQDYIITKKLIKIGADINISDNNNNLPLHCAVLSNNYKIVKLLLRNNSKINIKNNNGETPLFLAVNKSVLYMKWSKNPERVINIYRKIVKLLLKYGADPNIKLITEDYFIKLKKFKDIWNISKYHLIRQSEITPYQLQYMRLVNIFGRSKFMYYMNNISCKYYDINLNKLIYLYL